MLARSPSGTSSSASVITSLPIGVLSPVSAASCVSIVAVRSSRPSAGTMSPASSSTMSPGTSSWAGICTRAPSRRTRDCGSCIVASASTLLRASISWRVPMTTLITTRNPTMSAVDPCPMAALTAATAISMMFIGSRSCWKTTDHTDGGGLRGQGVRAVPLPPGRDLGGGQARRRDRCRAARSRPPGRAPTTGWRARWWVWGLSDLGHVSSWRRVRVPREGPCARRYPEMPGSSGRSGHLACAIRRPGRAPAASRGRRVGPACSARWATTSSCRCRGSAP